MKVLETKDWLYAIPEAWPRSIFQRSNFQGVGRTREDAIAAFDQAKEDNNINLNTLGTEIGPSVNKVDRWVVKFQEVVSKTIGTILPLVGGFAFLNEAATKLFGPENSHDPAMGLIMGVIGTAAIAIAPRAAWEFGEAYNKIFDWMERNDLPSAYTVRPNWHK